MRKIRPTALLLSCGLLLFLGLWRVSTNTEAAPDISPVSMSAVTHTFTRDSATPLKGDRLQATLSGPLALPSQGQAIAGSLAAADFDEDGTPDLVSTHASGNGSTLVWQRGNADAIFPRSKAAQLRKAQGQFTDDPFFTLARTVTLPEQPHFVAAGDFNADGHRDILAAAYGSNSFYLLAGDGRGEFATARQIKVNGQIDQIVTGEIGRADGQSDVAVAVSNDTGSRLLVYEHPEGAFKRDASDFKLPNQATAIAIGNLDSDGLTDVAVACGNQLVFIHGHQQIYPWDMIRAANVARPSATVGQRTFGFRIGAVAIGNFAQAAGKSVALLADDGFVHLLTPPASPPSGKANRPGTRWLKSMDTPSGTFSKYERVRSDVSLPAEESARRGYQMRTGSSSKPNQSETVAITGERKVSLADRSKLAATFFTAPSRIAEWNEKTWFTGFQLVAAAGSLTTARVSGSDFDDLIAIDRAGQQLLVINNLSGHAELMTLLKVDGQPGAVLPMRSNSDALNDLAVSVSGGAPAIISTGSSSTFTVDSTVDLAGLCQQGEPCTLRGAIQAANLNPGPDFIEFAIPGDGVHTITLNTELPVIGGPTTIDATTQPGYTGTPLIEISGDSLASAADGLKVRASDCVVRGFAINQLPHFEDQNGSFVGGNGISIETLQNQTRHTNNFIEGNFLGTNAGGDEDRGNTSTGLIIFDADNNTIGGTIDAARNVISGNGNQDEQGAGISMVNSNNNQFKGNYIGVDASGTIKLGNSLGLDLTGSFNTVGGDEAGAANTISGNGEPNALFPDRCGGNGVGIGIGVSPIFHEGENTNLTNFNNIKGNRIGTDSSGTEPLGNCGFGVTASPVTSTAIGSIAEVGRNVISDNGHYAVNCSYIQSFPLEGGFCIVSGNNIGTDISGTIAMRNDGRNVLPGLSPVFAVVTTEAVPGAFASVGAPGGTTPGGSCTGFCNLISGNDSGEFQHDAVAVFGVGLNGVFNSYIGTNISGTDDLPNYTAGSMGGNSFLGSVGFVGGSPDDLTPLGNLVSGNSCGGFRLQTCVGNCEAVTSVSVQNNLFGTNVNGTQALPNTTDAGCANPAIKAAGSFGSVIFVGGTAHPLEKNVISGNAFDAIHIQGNTFVQNNYVGVASDGITPLANAGHGIKVLPIGADRPNFIGGSAPNESNIIRNNGGSGIFLERYIGLQAATDVDVSANSIFNNGGLGIDIFPVGVNSNDAGDNDNGPNELQNYPLLDAPVFNANGTVTVHGWLNSIANSSFRIDFYANATSDPTKYGEGQTHFGSRHVSTDNQGRVEFTFTSTAAVPSGQKITATATNAGGNTSEFSCAGGECIADVGVEITDDPDPATAGDLLTYTLNVTNAGPATATNVVVTNNLPGSVNFGSAISSQGSCSRNGVIVTCNVGTMNVGANVTVTIEVTTTTEGEITDTASVTGAQEDPNPDNDTDTETTQVGPGVIIVTTNGDESDANLGDDICDVDPNTPESQCTLRAALEFANARAGRDAIAFDIPGGPNQTISPQSALPTISQSVSIDATTQPGHSGVPVIRLSGAAAGGDGLKITAGNCYLAGLAITQFSGNGIYILGGPGGNVIESNIIGTDANGADGLGIGAAAILIENSPNNQIGRGGGSQNRLQFPLRGPAAPNLGLGNLSNIFAKSGFGAKVVGASALGNVFKANLIGAAFTDGFLTALPNVLGMLIQGAPQTVIGGTSADDSCTVVASNGPGIKVEGLASLTKIFGSFFGTTALGEAGFGNNGPGILVEGASETEIGGILAGMRNTISGNNGPGVALKGLANAAANLTKITNNNLGGKPDLSGILGNLGENVVSDGAGDTTIESNVVVGSQTGCGMLIKDTQGLLLARPNRGPVVPQLFGTIINKNIVGLLGDSFAQQVGNALGGICIERVAQVTIGGLIGNVIAANNGPGILLRGQETQGFKLLGNLIGTNRNGASGLGNLEGILIEGAKNGDIGGFGPGEGNVVSGNQREALKAIASLQELSSQLRVLSNSFGVKPDNTNPLGNNNSNILLDGVSDVTIDNNSIAASITGCGVYIRDSQQVLARPVVANGANRAPALGFISKLFRNKVGLARLVGGANLGNLLGGICVEQTPAVQIGDIGLGNEIAGNSNGPGVHLFGSRTLGFKITGNFVGTTSAGLAGLGNKIGIFLEGVRDGSIGGTASGEGNVISGNLQEGLRAQARLAEALELVSNLQVFANKFGVKPDESGVIGNTKDNILIDSAIDVTIQENLLVASQTGCGVQVFDTHEVTAGRISPKGKDPKLLGGLMKIFKNTIGLSNVLQGANLGNVRGGICLEDVIGAQIGDLGLGNEIGGSTNGAGVLLSGSRTSLVELVGNFIGTDSQGRTGLGNAIGVMIEGAKNNSIGRGTPGSGNTIGFNLNGIVIKDKAGTEAELNKIFGNLIGVFRNLDSSLRSMSNAISGISIENSTNNVVGEPGVPASRNLISANGGPGVIISGFNATFNRVSNNSIGTDEVGSLNLGNALHGVLLLSGARLNTVGGPAPGAGNIIAFNLGAGVALDATAGDSNNIDPNSIFGNGTEGIDLGNDGPTPNDPGDADDGPNELQNFPEITSAVINTNGALVIQYRLNSNPANSAYGTEGVLVEFFEADQNDSGKNFIGDTHYTEANFAAGSPGMATFTLPNAVAAGITTGDRIVASATDADNNTSEFTSTNVGTVVSPTARTGSVLGRILTSDGLPLAGVTIELSGTESHLAITDAEGRYRLSNLETTGFYFVAPARANYTFSPASRAFSLLQESAQADFTATAAASQSANPLDTPAFFVRQQYLDFLGREPDTNGFAYWLNEIMSCGSDQSCIHSRRLTVSDAFFVESEWQLTGGFVNRIHKAAFGQYPIFTDYLSDRAQLSAMTTQEFTGAFVGRGEFLSQYPDSLTAADYIETLAANAGNVFTSAQKDELIAGLTSGSETRASVLEKIVKHATFVENEYNSIFVTSLYLHYLRREPEPGGFAFWLAKINEYPPHSLAGQHSLVCAFITSREYQQRFSSVVTRNNSDCGR